MNICEACNKNEAVDVCCVPGVPYSAAYCQQCLEADNHPLGILIANTVCCGGLEHCADWWKEIVMHTLKYQNKTLEQFNSMVEQNIKELDVLCRAHDEKEEVE